MRDEKLPRTTEPMKPSRPRKAAQSDPAEEARMHPITFCVGCDEPIPVHALACFRCGTRQPHGERALQVVFCTKCGRDYPARAMACYHCGHINPKHPYLKGNYAS